MLFGILFILDSSNYLFIVSNPFSLVEASDIELFNEYSETGKADKKKFALFSDSFKAIPVLLSIPTFSNRNPLTSFQTKNFHSNFLFTPFPPRSPPNK